MTKMNSLLEKFMDQRRLYSFEGPRGVRNLSTITAALGYGSLTAFLEDNPGAVQAIVDWVSDHPIPEFVEKLEQEIEEK